MQRSEIIAWLRETNEARLEELWRRADLVRQQSVGGEVHLRGLIEISNHCIRLCGYCGLRLDHRELPRYRMTGDEIMACVREGVAFGYGTVVLQAGEDPGIRADWMAGVVRRIKAEIADGGDLEPRRAGAGRTGPVAQAGAGPLSAPLRDLQSQAVRADPPARARRVPLVGGVGTVSDRIALLGMLRELGYEVGSGVMIGIPGQSYDDLAGDLELFRELNLDMIGVGPFLMHPETPLADPQQQPARAAGRAGAGFRANDLQGDRPDPLALPAGEYPQHDGVGHAEPAERPRAGPGPRGEHRHAQSHAAQVSHPLRDLSEQGLHPGIGRNVPPLPGRAHREHRPHAGQRPGRLAELRCPIR